MSMGQEQCLMEKGVLTSDWHTESLQEIKNGYGRDLETFWGWGGLSRYHLPVLYPRMWGYTNTGCDSLTPRSQGTKNAWRIRTVDVKEPIVLQGTSESRQIIYRETICILPWNRCCIYIIETISSQKRINTSEVFPCGESEIIQEYYRIAKIKKSR